MCDLPFEGGLYWAMMRYAEIMAISKSRLMKLQIETRNVAKLRSATSRRKHTSRDNVSLPRDSRITLLENRRSRAESSLNEGDETPMLSTAEIGVDELEKRLATVEGIGRAAWLKAFMHLTSYLRTFHPPPREERTLSDRKIPICDVVFNGSGRQSANVVTIDASMRRAMLMRKKRQPFPSICTDPNCPARVNVTSG